MNREAYKATRREARATRRGRDVIGPAGRVYINADGACRLDSAGRIVRPRGAYGLGMAQCARRLRLRDAARDILADMAAERRAAIEAEGSQ